MRFQKRHKAWNKGLTKEIDNRLKLSGKRGSKTKKKLYAEGKIIHWTKLENYKEKFKNGEHLSSTCKPLQIHLGINFFPCSYLQEE
jgi:hypothetical protein